MAGGKQVATVTDDQLLNRSYAWASGKQTASSSSSSSAGGSADALLHDDDLLNRSYSWAGAKQDTVDTTGALGTSAAASSLAASNSSLSSPSSSSTSTSSSSSSSSSSSAGTTDSASTKASRAEHDQLQALYGPATKARKLLLSCVAEDDNAQVVRADDFIRVDAVGLEATLGVAQGELHQEIQDGQEARDDLNQESQADHGYESLLVELAEFMDGEYLKLPPS